MEMPASDDFQECPLRLDARPLLTGEAGAASSPLLDYRSSSDEAAISSAPRPQDPEFRGKEAHGIKDASRSLYVTWMM